MVSLESALELVSSKIGSNSKYEIKEISMIFRRKVINDILYQQEYICEPHWMIRGNNLADGKEVSFYIDLRDGELEYVQS